MANQIVVCGPCNHEFWSGSVRHAFAQCRRFERKMLQTTFNRCALLDPSAAFTPGEHLLTMYPDIRSISASALCCAHVATHTTTISIHEMAPSNERAAFYIDPAQSSVSGGRWQCAFDRDHERLLSQMDALVAIPTRRHQSTA